MKAVPSVQVEELPRSVEEFVTLRDEIAGTPQGGAALMIAALLVYAEDSDLGQQCLAAAIDPQRLEEGLKGYDGWQLRSRELSLIQSQIRHQPFIPRSYVRGATPENGYQLPDPPYIFDFAVSPYSGDPESGTYKVFVSCSGAATPRPVTVSKHGPLWKAYEWSTLVVGVRTPAQP